jgi:hypothetical protein
MQKDPVVQDNRIFLFLVHNSKNAKTIISYQVSATADFDLKKTDKSFSRLTYWFRFYI